MKLSLLLLCITPLYLLAMQPEAQPETPLTCMQKSKKITWNCCFPKIAKIACSYCLCGKSCSQTVQTFGEYKIVNSIIPWLQNPYHLGATIAVAGCIGCNYGLYKAEFCCFKKKERTPEQLLTMPYTHTDN